MNKTFYFKDCYQPNHKNLRRWTLIILALAICLIAAGCTDDGRQGTGAAAISPEDIPEYSQQPYIEINGNEPYFDQADLTTTAFETYSDLDDLGRCGLRGKRSDAHREARFHRNDQARRLAYCQIPKRGWKVFIQSLPPDRLPADSGKRQ